MKNKLSVKAISIILAAAMLLGNAPDVWALRPARIINSPDDDEATIATELRIVDGAEIITITNKNIKAKFWETAGCRGVRTDPDDFSPDNVSRQTAGFAEEVLERIAKDEYAPLNGKGKAVRVAFAFDSRKDSDVYAYQMAKVLTAYKGFEVEILDEPLPTPIVARLTQHKRAQAYDFAFHVTPSHNQLQYGGIKLLHKGSVNEHMWTYFFEKRANAKMEYPVNPDAQLKKVQVVEQLIEEYLQEEFPNLIKNLAAFRKINPDAQFTVDLMDGSMASFAPLFERLGIKIVRSGRMKDIDYSGRTYKLADGKEVGFAPDPTQSVFYQDEPEFQEFKNNAPNGSVYFLIDGDGDRLVTIVKKGGELNFIKPNQFGPLAADYILENNLLPGINQIIRTYVTSAGMDAVAKSRGIPVTIVPVGSKYFNQFVPYAIALEESGHLVFGDKFDDTIYQVGLILTMMSDTNKDVFTLLAETQERTGYKGIDNRDDFEDISPEVRAKFIAPLTGTPEEVREKSLKAVNAITEQSGKELLEALVVVEGEYGIGRVIKLDEYVNSLFTDNPLVLESSNRGIIVRFNDLSWGGARLSGTGNTGRLYTEGRQSPEERQKIADAFINTLDLPKAPSELPSELSIEDQVNRMAQVLDKALAQAQRMLIDSIDRAELLANFAETTGVSEDIALANMITSGLVPEGAEKGNYSLAADFYAPEKLNKFIELQIASSSNPDDADTGLIRIERIISDAINPDTFIRDAAAADKLTKNSVFVEIVKLWKLDQAAKIKVQQKDKYLIGVDDIMEPEAAAKFYQQSGLDVRFALPFTAFVSNPLLPALLDYQAEVEKDMARGEFNYRGTGTKQNIEQFYTAFQNKEYREIREFIKDNFGIDANGLKAIFTNGIGANDQFMWALVEMYNQNRPEGAPIWYHVTTARDWVKIRKENPWIAPENTLFIDISRSGGTWEGVEVAIRSRLAGFNKRIVLANGGALKDIAGIPGTKSLSIGMSPDIGGRNMHRKTTIYYTAQTVAGMFLPQMNSSEFAKWNHIYDAANDFGNPDTLALNSGKFIHSTMKLFGVDHIALVTNSAQLGLAGTELDQYVMEGLNKKDLLDVGKYDLTKAGELQALAALAKSPSAKHTVGIVLLDKAAQDYQKHAAAMKELEKSMPLMLIEIDSNEKRAGESGFKGVTLRQQSAIDILWTDTVSVLAKLLRVDANSNPNVKVVRGMTKDYVADWEGVADRYAADPIGTGKTDLLVNIGYSGASEFSAERQISIYDIDSARTAARSLALHLADQKLLSGRSRLNLFTGTDELMPLGYDLRNYAYGTDLVGKYGWIPDAPIFKTDVYPNRAHKGHEATLSPLAAPGNINIFLNARQLGDDEVYNEPFKNMLADADYPDYARVNGANIHQTNDSMTFPNIQRAAQVSPTILFEFNRATPDVQKKIRAFYQAFVEELIKQEQAAEISESDAVVAGTVSRFNDFVRDTRGIRGAIIIEASKVLENAGSMRGLGIIKENNSDIKAVVWAKNESEAKMLRAIGVKESGIADAIVVNKEFFGVYQIVKERFDLSGQQTVLVNSADEGMNIVVSSIGVSTPDNGNINLMPIVFANAIARLSPEELKEKYKEFLAQNLANLEDKGIEFSEEAAVALANISDTAITIPLATTRNAEIIKAQEVYAKGV